MSLNNCNLGAFRMVPAGDSWDLMIGCDKDRVFCPNTTPRCETCRDFGQIVDEDSDVSDCPHCDGITPDYTPEDGVIER